MHQTINTIPRIKYTDRKQFFLIAGPCVVESDEISVQVAETVSKLCDDFKIPYIFKASYKKANRSKLESFTGIGDVIALEIIQRIGKIYDIPTLTDVHTEPETIIASEYADILQIPAFLCRQTELLISAAYTGKHINIKKGQFLSGESMKFAVDKVMKSGNNRIMLTERGSMFGYQDLVVDFRNIPAMQEMDVPVILDITHSLQQPNQSKGVSGGRPEMIETIAKAGIAAGADGIFLETHPHPEKALSDGENMLKLDKLEPLLEKLVRLKEALKDTKI